ncbi:hypothetical protein OAC72_00520 [Flavobacteriales bacterium]|nr:hypothetical protein [Flavobacteriales bacterium]
MNNKLLVALFILILLLISSLFYQSESMKKQMDLKIQFIEQKNIIRDELDDLVDEHDELLEEYGDLNNQLFEKDSLIQNQIAEIKNLIRNKKDLKEARIKIENLKRISKRYLADIDSLFYINERLASEKDSVIKVNKNINWKNYTLNKKNIQLSDQVNKGSVLEVSNISVEALRFRGTGKEVPTRSAQKTQILRSCFNISANQIAKSGQKSLCIQYLNPRGEILNSTDSVNINQVPYSFTDSINYLNKDLEICIDFERNKMLIEGNYVLKVFIDDLFLAESKFNLR